MQQGHSVAETAESSYPKIIYPGIYYQIVYTVVYHSKEGGL